MVASVCGIDGVTCSSRGVTTGLAHPAFCRNAVTGFSVLQSLQTFVIVSTFMSKLDDLLDELLEAKLRERLELLAGTAKPAVRRAAVKRPKRGWTEKQRAAQRRAMRQRWALARKSGRKSLKG